MNEVGEYRSKKKNGAQIWGEVRRGFSQVTFVLGKDR